MSGPARFADVSRQGLAAEVDTVVTPEAVLLSQPVAGIPSRVLARLIDLLAQALILAILGMAAVFTSTVSETVAAYLGFGSILVVLLVYPAAFEYLWRGRTPGKAALGLRVISGEGGPVGPQQALMRAVAGLVDIYLSVGSLAMVTSFLSPRGQRLGDLMAGTFVVREQGSDRRLTPVVFPTPPGHAEYVDVLDVAQLGDAGYGVVREALLRLGTLDGPTRLALTNELGHRVVARIGVPVPTWMTAEEFLAAVCTAYQRREGGLAAVGLGHYEALVNPWTAPTAPPVWAGAAPAAVPAGTPMGGWRG
ncbi:MAG: RDD family protein [Microthrixaceae bacterium]